MSRIISTQSRSLNIGVATTEIEADDSMVIGGGIIPAFASGQEGLLGASAIIIEKDTKVCMVSCDVIMLQRDILDDVCKCIEAQTGIPFDNILISATHTHHAPTTVTVHGYERDELFCNRVKEAIVKSAITANKNLQESQCSFACGHENTAGQNSRMILDDGTILWVPLEERYASLEPTGVYIPDLPVLSFEAKNGNQKVIMFNHSSHNIGSLECNKRSPGFYGLAAQELTKELGGTVVFLSGASGSTHNLTLTANELVCNIKDAVKDASFHAAEEEIHSINVIKTEFEYRVRTFDEEHEDRAVSYYCNKRRVDWCDNPEEIIEVFRKMRQDMTKHQGELRKSWLQVLLIGEIAFVAVPGELFGKLAYEIKANSPFDNTHIIGYANDHIGYIPDRDAYKLGGYQVWAGFHSCVEMGTGEMLVDTTLRLLNKLHSPATQEVSL